MQYVQNLALHSGEIDEKHEGEENVPDQGKVTLSTIHACKGAGLCWEAEEQTHARRFMPERWHCHNEAHACQALMQV